MSWLKGCEICNAGLVAEVDRLVKERGISVRRACKLMAEEGERKIGDLVYKEEAIRARYRLHKNLREPHPEKKCHRDTEAVENLPPQEVGHSDPPTPQTTELSSQFHREAAQASAQAKKARETSELERAAMIVKQAARLLERIVEGDIKDNGSEYDRLSAESIRRHLPGIIISAYQLGIDPEKAVNFYKGGKKVTGKRYIIQKWCRRNKATDH